ncbi:MAG: hypothetical protein L6R36_008353 [Xanthoria steineri]|nr:MAG: hypothetical protein L6R36_008353 [Xanthoria steineri]
MQYTSIFLAALAATTTLAAPWVAPSHDNKLQVTLSGPHTTPAQKYFPASPRTASAATTPTPPSPTAAKANGPIRGEEATKVSQIICDPAFWQITAGTGTGTEIRVQLSNQAAELAIQTAFTEGSRQEKALNPGLFTSVQIMVGALVQKQDYRCQVVDKAGQAVVATGNTNTSIPRFRTPGEGGGVDVSEGE